MKRRQPLSTTAEWTLETINAYHTEIERLANDFRLDTYPVVLEVISSEQMMDTYASSGMPISYHHWSYGKHFVETQQRYQRGQMGLAYEIVINSNPCIAYLLEENSMAMQALVIAHAAYGHNSFFKSNYLFKSWTQADSIIDYFVFAKQYIQSCEEQYGIDTVEYFIDHCHALSQLGVDKYKHPRPLSLQKEKIRQQNREQIRQSQVNELWRTLPASLSEANKHHAPRFPLEPQENVLYFIEKNAPLLKPWQREIIRIVRKIAQYFYPQTQTKVMNEGWATFWHYTLINALYDDGLVTDEFMLEVIQNHSAVITQPDFDSPLYNGINPYTLGFSIFRDIQRVCQSPTDEDRATFPTISGSDWISSVDFAMRNFKDESFIAQYLSPKVIRDLRLFSLVDDDEQLHMHISAIHDEEGYQSIRETLSHQYDINFTLPNIQVYDVDVNGSRGLTLRHFQYQRQPLHPDVMAVLAHLHHVWMFPITLESINEAGEVTQTWQYPPEAT